MARRKKEAVGVHRSIIAAAAEKLFSLRGINAVSMDDIAREAGYSKATLYVYFQNKDEIIAILTLASMKKLYDYITIDLDENSTTRTRYDKICLSLVRYQEEYPLYFDIVLKTINIDFNNTKCVPEDKETFLIGERINNKFMEFLREGIRRGELHEDNELIALPFTLWGMLSGLIQISVNKEAYILQQMHHTKQQFLEHGFEMLYRSIKR